MRAEGPASERLALEARARASGTGALRPQTVPGHEVDEVLLVAGWFRKFPNQLERTIPLDAEPSDARALLGV